MEIELTSTDRLVLLTLNSTILGKGSKKLKKQDFIQIIFRWAPPLYVASFVCQKTLGDIARRHTLYLEYI